MTGLLFKMAAIGLAGIGAQWAAWWLRVPAIALLLIAGIILGPVTGYVNPYEEFGDVYKPAVALAVAIILFEGGLTLNFSEIKETGRGVLRIVIAAGPLVWLFSTLAAHYAAGLSWPAAAVLGAILVVTGPTVIIPLLRNAQLSQRPASLLRWEAIVNDPIGALFAVIAFEVYLVLYGEHTFGGFAITFIVAAVVAVGGGYLGGKGLAWIFQNGRVPDFLKAPVLLIAVLLAYAISDAVLEESGLLTVTVMGITMANSRMASLAELRRFKETVTILLVSGLFIMLTASLQPETFAQLGWGTVIFVALVLFFVRPFAIFIATIGAGLSYKERLLISWIAPRGIVAVAVSGLFGQALVENGVADGAQLTALAFAVVAATILLHGFSLKPLAGRLGLKSAERPGILLIGGSSFADALAEKLLELNLPILVADSNYKHLRKAKMADVPVYFGEVLSEQAHHDITLNRYSHLVALTDNDAYNSLVCTEFGPELGRNKVFQIGQRKEDDEDRKAFNFTLGGRPLFRQPRELSDLRTELWRGWSFSVTKLTEEYSFKHYMEARPDNTALLLWVKPNENIVFRMENRETEPGPGDTLLAFGPPGTGDVARENDKPRSEEPPEPDTD
jgi:NhaP-type Na+/H+ or K+/H+ antiporter